MKSVFSTGISFVHIKLLNYVDRDFDDVEIIKVNNEFTHYLKVHKTKY